MFTSYASDRVIGGTQTTNKEHPWQLSLQTRFGGHLCGASLIRNDLVITAAHCVDAFGARDFRIYGKSSTGEMKKLRRLARVKSIHIHPDFKEKNLAHDIAILKLKRPISLSSEVKTIRIPDNTKNDFNFSENFKGIDGKLISSGWGSKEPPSNFPIFSKELMEVEVKAIGTTTFDMNDNVFNQNLIQDFNMSDEMIEFLLNHSPNVLITTGMIPETGNCLGDSGGPLVYYEQGKDPLLVGITSYAAGGSVLCKGIAGFTNIQAYRDWLRQFID
jgi:secreted trypsin-like serine protease